ncbi:MAG: Crp/Fnr family transcriptional regulator [Gammaproteobacteria bacterium]|nr:Crp/Fnr family transcriptional regulator [Gammaproteobacteria bacterium]MCW8909224.1 Crp/Fnr family transcriptional regulator [Gammaproteobacteria bacterium]MCW9006185.1 Crp/Fnr family transcriptional regulator [Gammaproteobacteria bacterium]MCW9057212.1 Crp/Fnr family transcriptional regulator [Gammaproteobacteria bacterium]
MGINNQIQLDNFAGPCIHKPVEIRCASCILDTSYYFDNLSIEAKRDLQLSLNLKLFNKKQALYKEGDDCKHLYILMTGEVKVYKTLANGKQQIHKLAQVPGDLIACEDLFMETHGSSAEALNDVSVCHLKFEDLRNSTQRYQEISETLMQAMSRNLNAYIRHIANLGQKNALERLASYLIYLNDTCHQRHLKNSQLEDLLSRVELADMLGITQRTLIRSIKQLEAMHYINMNKNSFTLLDLQALKKISAGC